MSSVIAVLSNPALEYSLKTIKDGLAKKRTIIIAGLCSVTYQGRASSTLNDGERVLIIKADSSVLIHRPTGLEPVNYMSSSGEGLYESKTVGCLFRTSQVEDSIMIKAIQRKTKEQLSVFFTKIYVLVILSLVDKAQFLLYASEKDMQSAVLIRPNLIEEGFRVINYEKKVKPGFIDVYGIDSRGRFVVIEIKRKTADKAAVLQLAKYLDVVRGDRGEDVRGIIAAPRISRGVQKLLATLNLEFKYLDPRECAELIDKTRVEERLENFFDYD